MYLNFQAVETFKECGRKDSKMAGAAATNLSFIYFLVGQSQQLYAILLVLIRMSFTIHAILYRAPHTVPGPTHPLLS